MKAIIIRKFGEPEVFEEAELPRPEVIPGHVLIRVMATSINPVDYKIRRNGPPITPDLPAVLHGDVAGVIEEVGEGVTAFRPGDEVYACAGGVKGTGGALADFMLADAALVAFKPKSLSMGEAAALPLVTITAWEGLIDRIRIQSGQKVLVHAATGGVGHIGIQLAKWAGAEVYTTASSPEKMEIGRQLGADVAINYREQSVKDYVDQYTGGKGFDVVFDTIGGDVLQQSVEAACFYGTVVNIAGAPAFNSGPVFSKALNLHAVFMLIPMLHNVGRSRHGQILTEAAELVDAGKLRPLIDPQTFNFSQVAPAHRHAESGDQIGKVVIVR